MGVVVPLFDPSYALFEGSGTTTEVPGVFPLGIDGVGYFYDTTVGIRPSSIPQLREQADSGTRPGEGSLNPEGLWRRSTVSWHRGAGQTFLDREDSDPFRFRSSKGVDVFGEHFEFTLLPDTEQKRASANTNLFTLPVGSKFYIVDGTEVRHTSDPSVGSPTFADADIQNSESAQTVESITTDGFNVYAALGSNGVHLNERGATSTSHYSDLQATLVRYVKGRLMASETNSIYNVVASGAAPSALLDHDNTDFVWTDFAEGKGQIFAGGFSGELSEIWRTAVKADGTSLDTPSIAARLNDGEVLRAIEGYQGFLLIGTDDGIRLASEDDNGDLQIGALVDLGVSVRQFEPQGKDGFVWFTWTNLDSGSTGLGRLDLTQLLPNGAPAHASDLMASTQGTVLSVASFGGKRYFAVSEDGFWGETDDKVASGSIDSGLIAHGVPEDKTALFFDVRHHDTGLGSVTPSLSVGGGTFSNLAASDSGTGKRSGTGQSRGELHEVRLTLARSAADSTLAPTVTSWTLLSDTTGVTAYHLDIPVLLHTKFDTPQGTPIFRSPREDKNRLIGLRNAGKVISVQDGRELLSGKVVDFGGELYGEFGLDPADPQTQGVFPVRVKIFGGGVTPGSASF